MEQYKCSECGGVSDQPGVCQTDGCSMKGQPLVKTADDQGQNDDPGEVDAQG